MGIRGLQRLWDALGRSDPLWAILTDPAKKGNRWRLDEFFETGVREIDALSNYISALGVGQPQRRALDFGCGVGRLTQALARKFDRVDGVDIAPSMIARAREYNRGGDRCHFHVNDSGDLQLFDHDTFDLIYSNITLQHIPPPHAAGYLGELVRVLAPGGLLIFQIPAGVDAARARHPKERLKRMLPAPALTFYYAVTQPWRSDMTMHPIAKQEVVGLLEGAGARMVDISPDDSAGDGWICYRYCATKSGSPR